MPYEPPATSSPSSEATRFTDDASSPSIAVLPFVNMSADKDNEYFSDGISEELLNVLVRCRGLGVASRTSSFGYKGSTLGAAAIAKELKVEHVLEGSVRKAGNHVRITAQLIDAVNDRHLWSETYDRELTDIFAIQDEIANAIVDALRELTRRDRSRSDRRDRARRHREPAGLRLYLKARELFIARTDLQESMRLFERVTQIDPNSRAAGRASRRSPRWPPGWGSRTATTPRWRSRPPSGRSSSTRRCPCLGRRSRRAPSNRGRSTGREPCANGSRLAADPRNATAYLWRGIAWIDPRVLRSCPADLDRCLELEPGYANALRTRRWRCCGRARRTRRWHCLSAAWRRGSCSAGPNTSLVRSWAGATGSLRSC